MLQVDISLKNSGHLTEGINPCARGAGWSRFTIPTPRWRNTLGAHTVELPRQIRAHTVKELSPAFSGEQPRVLDCARQQSFSAPLRSPAALNRAPIRPGDVSGGVVARSHG